MPNYRHLIIHESITGLPADRVVNNLYSNSVDDAAAMLFADRIVEFFGTAATGATRNIQEYMGASVSRAGNVHEIRVYDLADPEPRVPVGTRAFGASAPASGSSTLPREVAVCLSFQAVQISGVPQRNRRGRIFIGPLNTAAAEADVATGDLRPSSDFMDDLELAADELLADTAGDWVVWSETLGQAFDVDNGWIDNAFDTMRSRGVSPTLRQTFT